jgi:transcriptional regulator with XRE-family HTH domain
MKAKYSPSINIIRDEQYDLNYTVTPNSKKIVTQINDLFIKGFHSLNIIGSYGTGKSSFLWALEKSLLGKSEFFKLGNLKSRQVDIINIVGEYDSIKSIIATKLGITQGSDVSENILIELATRLSQKDSLTLLVIDEFGKLLEYAVKNEPQEEIYFLQQLAELFNDANHKGLLITTLHQSFEAYGHGLSEAERNEWVKVKGRFKDLTFNEPIEQLLLLAADNIKSKPYQSITKSSNKVLTLQNEYHITNLEDNFGEEIAEKLWPLDVISAYLLCIALQRYGQNERSLFTFLEAELGTLSKHQNESTQLGIPEIYDYLYHEFYSYLNSKYNSDYTIWSMIHMALDRIDSDFNGKVIVAEDIIKVIGFVSLFGHKGAHVEDDFIIDYLSYLHDKKELKSAIEQLVNLKILRFNRFSKSYKITEGTDLNIESELLQVSNEIESKLDIVHKLEEYFDFAVINAKSVSYKTGTPRFFQYYISEEPLKELSKKQYQIDGVINLVFDSNLDKRLLKSISAETDDFIYASFQNISDIKESIYEIEKTGQVIKKYGDDKVAVKELQSIQESLKSLLNHQVLDALFTKDVEWYYHGKKIKVDSKKALYKQVSEVCEKVYHKTPVFRNELINRHFISGNIANSKKILFDHLVNNHHKEDLAFSKDHFPAEKTIYLTLLKNTGIHSYEDGGYSLVEPQEKSFIPLWEHSESFLELAKNERKTIEDFYEHFKTKPFKLTTGFLDFWIPIYLFIKRDDFALFGKEEGYLPEVNEALLYLFTRNASKYEIKAFDVKGVKLDLYNKYREFLQLKDVSKVNNKSLIESIRPFLVFYRELNGYTQHTKRLSTEAISIRETIQKTQDPEKLFFEEFPKNLGTSLKEILKSESNLEEYVNKLRLAIKELRSSFDELVNRVETYLVEEVLYQKSLSFGEYKEIISSRYIKLKEHMLLPTQKSLLIRLKSPLDDRTSWLNSICQVVLGKSLDSLKDSEEDVLKEKIKRSLFELDNLLDIAKKQKDSNQDGFKIQLTSFENGLQEETVLIPTKDQKELEEKLKEVSESLGTNKKMNLYLLTTLLKQQLDD